MLPVGYILKNNYQIVSHINSGGFGNTYLAHSLKNNAQVAVKEFFMKNINQVDADMNVVVADSKDQQVFVSQKNKFLREAQTLACLSNKHIVRVFDAFQENNTAYYVMEYIDGVSLSQLLKQRGGALSQQEATNVLIQMLDAVYAIHEKGLLHLDIKPANIMIGQDGVAKIIDFGTAKPQHTGNDTIATYTPAYAPLELQQQNPNAIGPWTDIYSLGATFYFLLTGLKPPQETDIVDDGAAAFLFEEETDEKTRALVEWMMQPARKKRPQNVSQVIHFIDTGEFPEYPVEPEDTVFTTIHREEPEPPHTVRSDRQPTTQYSQPYASTNTTGYQQPQQPQQQSSGCFWYFLVFLLLLAGAAWYLYNQGYFDHFIRQRTVEPQIEEVAEEDPVDEEALARQRELELYDELTALIDKTKQKVREAEVPEQLDVIIENHNRQWSSIKSEYEDVQLTDNHDNIIQSLNEGLETLVREKYNYWIELQRQQEELLNNNYEEDYGNAEEDAAEEATEESYQGDENYESADSTLAE